MNNAPKQLPLSLSLSEAATFSAFISQGNELAVEHLQAIAEGKGEAYLYLWGSAGAGCTHLLQALYYQTLAKGRQPAYLPVEELLQQDISIVQQLENVDLLCLDNVQLFAGNKLWEEAVFHLFNLFRQTGRQLVISANSVPADLNIELADLSSRLSWGLTCHIQPLADEYKAQALMCRAQAMGLELSTEVSNYLLAHLQRDMNSLVQMLEKLDQASLSAKRKLTIPFVKSSLGL